MELFLKRRVKFKNKSTPALLLQVQSRSSQLLNTVFQAQSLHPRSDHEQMDELSLSTIYSLLAALMQALSLGSLCVAISLLKWVSVTALPHYYLSKPMVTYSFGMPHHMDMHTLDNITMSIETRKIFFYDVNTVDITLLMISICFLSMFSGFAAFLLDFVELKMLGKYRIAFVTFLHILSGISIIALIAICIWCFMKTKEQLTKEEWKEFLLETALGESFYVILMSFAFIILAIMLSGWSMKLSRKGEHGK